MNRFAHTDNPISVLWEVSERDVYVTHIKSHAKSNALDEYALKMGLDIENGAIDAEHEPKPTLFLEQLFPHL